MSISSARKTMLSKLPSFSFGSSSHGADDDGEERKSRSLFGRRGRSRSPYGGRTKSRSPSTDRERDGASDYASDGGESVDYASSSASIAGERGGEESSDPGSEPESDEDEDDDEELDPTLLANTEANAGSRTTPSDYLLAQPALLGNPEGDAGEDGPNLVRLPSTPFGLAASSTTSTPSTTAASSATASPVSTGTGRMRRRKSTLKSELRLESSRPVYERNRCTITLTHGDPDGHVENDSSHKARKKKTYVVASDLSEEAYYAIEWAIGTVLRNGDELLFVTVMETDSKRAHSLCLAALYASDVDALFSRSGGHFDAGQGRQDPWPARATDSRPTALARSYPASRAYPSACARYLPSHPRQGRPCRSADAHS